LTSHLSQAVALINPFSLKQGAAKGSDWMKLGKLRLRKAFLYDSNLSCFNTLTASMAYKPATIAVVVTSAGMILPALSLTSIHSIVPRL